MSSLARTLSRIGNFAAILALAYMLAHILLEIVLRNVFARSTYVLDEFVGYAVSALTFLALGETLRTGKLIRVNLLHDWVGAGARKALEIFAMSSAIAVGAFASVYVGKSVLRSYQRGTTSASVAEVPQWLPEALLLAGLCIFVLQALAGLIVILRRSGEPA